MSIGVSVNHRKSSLVSLAISIKIVLQYNELVVNDVNSILLK